MSSTRRQSYGSLGPCLPGARVIPRGVGDKTRRVGSITWHYCRHGARAIGLASIKLAPFCLSSVVLIGVLSALSPMRSLNGVNRGDYRHRLRQMELQLRASEQTTIWRHDYRFELERYEQGLQYIEVGDEFYLYRPDLSEDERSFRLMSPYELAVERAISESQALDPAQEPTVH